ncbi:MAG: nicotinate-nucleotide--dimethylbenzimidazole phosphoribosyltransferase [Chloroflexi bacterium]|nr:nicotinate-nucleotide--dimethylbenzimidazole phosphoribosyltransferase [Chloroflexota bacterium]
MLHDDEATIQRVIGSIKPLDEQAMASARARQERLTKPSGSLGRLEELSIQLAAIRRQTVPDLAQKAIITMAGDHGVVAQGVSAYPQEVTAQMVQNFLLGGAAINVLARHVGARVVVVDMGIAATLDDHPALISRKVAPGTRDMTMGPAMSRREALRSIAAGIEVVEEEVDSGLDIVGTGDMGIGNTTPSSAICAVITKKPVEHVTGRGTGLDDAMLHWKVEIIEKAISVTRPDPDGPLDVLAKVGGFEIGALAGVMLGAAAHHVPVVIDGFVSGAAALVATGLCPVLKHYLIASHLSVEPGHQAMLEWIGLKPLLDLDMRLGEGTGAALGMFLAEAAAKLLVEMATFDEAHVTDRKLES